YSRQAWASGSARVLMAACIGSPIMTRSINRFNINRNASTHRRLGHAAVLSAALGSCLLMQGCNDAQAGLLLGAGGGALAGQAIGHNTTGTLVGAGLGAGLGY